MAWDLFTEFVTGTEDYIVRHNQNYETIELALNSLDAKVGGLVSESGGGYGLEQIFDRKGIIGEGSYDFTEGYKGTEQLSVGVGGFWDGSGYYSKTTTTTLSLAGQSTGTKYIEIDSSGTPVLKTTTSAATIRSFYWNSSTKMVSAKALYTGVAILFDGTDYADQLTSTKFGTFTSVSARLDAIEALLQAFIGYYEEDADSHSGLNFYYKGGRVRNDADIYTTADGYVALNNNSVNYVELNPTGGAVSANTGSFTSGRIPLFTVTCSGGAITDVIDQRTWAIAGAGGGGGGHTQNTDVGTTSPIFTLNRDEVAAPTEDCKLEVERGTEANAYLKYDEGEDKWKVSHDGLTESELATLDDLNLGLQELSKYVAVDDPQLVLSDLARSTSGDWEAIDLESYVTAPSGLAGAVLRVFFWDSVPGAGVNVKFRKGGIAQEPASAFTVWSGQTEPATIVVGVNDDYEVEFFVTASGSGTANLQVYLVGYLAKVTGVGTQDRSVSYTGLNVSAGSSQQFNKTGFMNRGVAHYLKTTATGCTTNYDIEIYAKDTFLAADLLYKAEGINPAAPFEDWLDFWVKDADGTNELHIKIDNNDVGNAGTFAVEIHAEQFA